MPTKRTPLVSVVIPAYNAARYLPESLQSVLGQTFDDFEILVVDDGSTDDTQAVLEPLIGRVKSIQLDNSGGPARPRNVGIQNARGRYIAFLDADDIWLPNKLEHSVSFLKDQPQLGMVFSDCLDFEEGSSRAVVPHIQAYRDFWRLEKRRVGEDRYIFPGRVIYESLLYENFIGTSGVVAPKEVLAEVGPFDEWVSLGGIEDMDMWFRIASKYDIGYIDQTDHRYRLRRDSICRQVVTNRRARIAVVEKHLANVRERRLRSKAHAFVSRCFFEMGYYTQWHGDPKEARSFYVSSLAKKFNLVSAKGVCVTLLLELAQRLTPGGFTWVQARRRSQ